MNDSIFTPKFDNTQKISITLKDIDRDRWLIDKQLLMPKHEAWLRREIKVRRAAGTTQIEGANLDEAAVNKLADRALGGRYTKDEQANINALDAYEFIDYLSDQQDIAIDELVIRELNRKFLRGSAETLTPGAYRKGQNLVGNFTPPDQGDVPGLMRSFALWLREEDEIHPVLKAGIAHIHLVAIHPFWDGNGRTARGLSTLILQRSLFGFRKLLALESHLFAIRDSYFTAIERALGTRFDLNYDATSWLEFFTLSLSAEAKRLVTKLTDWHRDMEDIYRISENDGWIRRQADGLMFAFHTGQITRSDYIEITGVSPVTASRDLAAMVKAGLLIPEGKTRTRIYRLNPKFSETQSKSPDEQLPLLPET
jgi:Fic family protein